MYYMSKCHLISFSYKVTSQNGSLLSDAFNINNTKWTIGSMNIVGLNRTNISNIQFLYNGTKTGGALIDNLRLNDTTLDKRITFYAGNSTYGASTNLTTAYQQISIIESNSTQPLLFWFDFNLPLLGINIDLNQLLYRGTS